MSIFPLIYFFMFLIDTLWFSFGYMFESKSLNNRVRSVEPTILGWTLALICYPPFNNIPSYYLNWYPTESPFFANPVNTLILRIIILLLFIIYYLKAITEERHLIREPEYVEYCKKVKYRFIPYIW